MNRTKTIALFAGIFAIAMTTVSLSGISGSPMIMASVPQSNEDIGMLGHVEYKVFDDDMNLKSYLQTDNIVVESGKDCAGRLIFGATTNGLSKCSVYNEYTYIGIGNGTNTEDATDAKLNGVGCATGAAVGELARKNVTATTVLSATGGGGTQVELDVGTDTFKFTGHNATTTQIITQSGLFNGNNGVVAGTGECTGFDATAWEMFSVKALSSPGVTVSAGDSLAVKWTITIN